jgi:hypothetical protein
MAKSRDERDAESQGRAPQSSGGPEDGTKSRGAGFAKGFAAAKKDLVMARTATRRSAARRKPAHRKKPAPRKGTRYWSGRVTRESNALDLEGGVFALKDPKRIAASLKRSAERSRRRKAEPYRSALSMLVFYINRAGKNLPTSRRRTLERAKSELRRQFGRE